ncbi:MAG: Uma2 family endonuclease [Deltaproteobacteria bacterium]|nr:Uma2 family endonuclease [Deltaproteobacteria bacterium]
MDKRNIYEQYGVREYWFVFPQEKVIEVLTLENNIYREFCKAKKTGGVKSKIIDGMTVELKDVFEI